MRNNRLTLIRRPLSKGLFFWLIAIVAAIAAATILATNHSADAIISFDEGFHGQAALFVQQTILQHTGTHLFSGSANYLYKELLNGLIWYPPLWAVVAGVGGVLFGPSIEVFRLASSFFYVLLLLTVYGVVLKVKKAQRPAFMCMALVATIPIVALYSHLMMLEEPLIAGVTASVSLVYLYCLNLIPRRWSTVLVVSVVCALGGLSKLAALPLIWEICAAFAVISSLLFYRQRFYRHFLKPELLLFILVSGAALYGYIHFEKSYFGVSMLDFHLAQTSDLSGETGNPIWQALNLAWQQRGAYLADFRHIPLLSAIWFGSVVLYGLWKRTAFSVLLVVWTVISYISFSAVDPKAPQYLISIYAPLAIATGLLINDLAELLPRVQWRFATAIAAACVLCISQVRAFSQSESYGWFAGITGQAQAASYIAEHAALGDRVMSWDDGNTFAIRVADLQKYPQITNGTHQACPAAMTDSTEWALVTNFPLYISSVDAQILTHAPWKQVGAYGSNKTTLLFHNPTTAWPLVLKPDDLSGGAIEDPTATYGKALQFNHDQFQPALWGCTRQFPYGQLSVTYRLKGIQIPADLSDAQGAVAITYEAYPNGEEGGRTVTVGELRKATHYTDFSFDVEHDKVNLPADVKLYVLNPVTVSLDSITVQKK